MDFTDYSEVDTKDESVRPHNQGLSRMQIAKELGVSPSTLTRMIRRGEVISVRDVGSNSNTYHLAQDYVHKQHNKTVTESQKCRIVIIEGISIEQAKVLLKD